MNNRKIEEIAVAAVRNEILRSELLADEIPVNDKTPSWDGEIWVYNNKWQTKNELYGKVPVQVKGKKVSNISQNETKYKIEKVDLENYYTNGGVLFFVIEIIDPDNTQIYYLSLLPLDIKEILKEMKDQKSITKRLRKLPSKSLELITRNFIHHSRKQSIPLISDVKVNEFDTYNTKIILPNGDNLEDGLFELGAYMYGHVEQFNIDIPLFKIDIEQIVEATHLSVGIDGNTSYTEVERIHEREKVTLKFGKSFVIEFPRVKESSHQVNIRFTVQGNIQDRIKDSKFMLELINAKKIELNKNKLSINPSEDYHALQEELTAYIKVLEEILETFRRLGIDFDSDLGLLTNNDIKKMELLRDAILYEKYDNLKLETKDNFLQFLIGELKIILVCIKVNDNWIVFDLFDLDALNTHFKITVISADEQHKVRHSPFTMFEIPELFSMSNLKVSAIEDSLKQVDYSNDFSYRLTNRFLLDLLKYYDENSERKEILELTYNIYDYINDCLPSDVLAFMNKMQTIKRIREFTFEEKKEIVNRKKRFDQNIEMLCGFAILLDSKIEFEILFDSLSDEQRQEFKTYPIYNLLK